jgi:3-oxoacyl-[acyl-carrier-protein] synthase-3
MTADQMTTWRLSQVKAIKSIHTDPETIDFIIVAHNYGDVKPDGGSDMVPSLKDPE